jgi:hypothetical protein
METKEARPDGSDEGLILMLIGGFCLGFAAGILVFTQL